MITSDKLLNFISAAVAPIKRKIVLAIAHGIIEATKDDGPIQLSQATYLADETKNDIRKMHHFGFSSYAPKGSECIAVSVAGNREASVIIASENRDYRFKNLEEGEAVIYSKDGDYLYVKNGTININASSKINITAPNIDLNGDVKITGELTAEKSITVTENVVATGDITGANIIGTASVTAPSISGAAIAGASMIVAGTELAGYSGHTHEYEDDNGSGTSTKTTGGVA